MCANRTQTCGETLSKNHEMHTRPSYVIMEFLWYNMLLWCYIAARDDRRGDQRTVPSPEEEHEVRLLRPFNQELLATMLATCKGMWHVGSWEVVEAEGQRMDKPLEAQVFMRAQCH